MQDQIDEIERDVGTHHPEIRHVVCQPGESPSANVKSGEVLSLVAT